MWESLRIVIAEIRWRLLPGRRDLSRLDRLTLRFRLAAGPEHCRKLLQKKELARNDPEIVLEVSEIAKRLQSRTLFAKAEVLRQHTI